jgi:hypothetical protein
MSIVNWVLILNFERVTGIEGAEAPHQFRVLYRNHTYNLNISAEAECLNFERVTGIEPVSPAWKASIKSHYTIPAYARFCELRRASPL